MSRYLVILFAFAFINCSDKSAETEESFASPVSNYSKLDLLFKDLASDTFYVFSNDESFDNPNYEFNGIPMDSAQITALGFDFMEEWNREMYACYKIRLDKSRIGLIVRGQGEYVASKIEMFVFDTEKDSVVNILELADTFGDAGDLFSSCSYIFKGDDKKLILNYHAGSYDHSVENIADTIVDHWHHYYLYDLSKTPVDTISKDSTAIVMKYPDIVKRLAGE